MSNLKEYNNKLLNDIIVSSIAESRNITEADARTLVSSMSFMEYHAVSEAVITPPSGQTITPSSTATAQKTQKTTSPPSQIKSLWPGQGAPVEVGMTVGIKGENGLPMPGTVSQVDMTANGVKVKNPTTGKTEWMNTDGLEPFMAAQDGTPQPGQTVQPSEDIQRLRELAGIKENCSAGASGAGAIAIAPMPMGKMKKRQETNEEVPKKEYTPKGPAKTIVGDTKPNQASGELSANLAVRGKKTASRSNNGFKK